METLWASVNVQKRLAPDNCSKLDWSVNVVLAWLQHRPFKRSMKYLALRQLVTRFLRNHKVCQMLHRNAAHNVKRTVLVKKWGEQISVIRTFYIMRSGAYFVAISYRQMGGWYGCDRHVIAASHDSSASGGDSTSASGASATLCEITCNIKYKISSAIR